MRGRDTSISERTVRFLSDPCWSSERSTRLSGREEASRRDRRGDICGGANGLGCGAESSRRPVFVQSTVRRIGLCDCPASLRATRPGWRRGLRRRPNRSSAYSRRVPSACATPIARPVATACNLGHRSGIDPGSAKGARHVREIAEPSRGRWFAIAVIAGTVENRARAWPSKHGGCSASPSV